MKQLPKIEKVMTPMPHTIGLKIKLSRAIEMMKENRFRHLPVQDEGRLVGVLTDRDIKLASSFVHDGGDAEKLTVEDVMTPDPYTTTPEAPLDQVASEMAEHKYGCAIVQQKNGKVVGIFTAVDALQVLATVLRENYRHE